MAINNGLNELDRCQLCQHTRLWHDENNPIHPFDPDGTASKGFMGRRGGRAPGRDRSTSQRDAEGPQIVSMTTDPVLRIALMNKGILTPTDLVVAEESLRAALAQQQEGSPWSAQREERPDSSTPTGRTSTAPWDEKASPRR